MNPEADRLAVRAFERWVERSFEAAPSDFIQACDRGALFDDLDRCHLWPLRTRLNQRAEASRDLKSFLNAQGPGNFKFQA